MNREDARFLPTCFATALSLILGWGGFACKNTADTPTEEVEATSDSPGPDEAAGADWRRVEPDALPESAKAKLEQAKTAKQALGKMLVGKLTEAVGEGDFAKGVSVCKEAAPMARKSIAETYEVGIGRTSFKVRNPDNAPLEWQQPYVDERVEEDVVLINEASDLRYMSPIMTAELCVKCHGTAEQIQDEVEEILAEKYPADEATGFAPGELRGWFWVELADR